MHHDMLGKRQYESATCFLRFSMAIPVEERQLVREVFDVKAGMKGKRHGTKLMESIVGEADTFNKVLMLLPETTRNETWYKRFGFETVQDSPKLMLRQPAVIRGNNGPEEIS